MSFVHAIAQITADSYHATGFPLNSIVSDNCNNKSHCTAATLRREPVPSSPQYTPQTSVTGSMAAGTGCVYTGNVVSMVTYTDSPGLSRPTE